MGTIESVFQSFSKRNDKTIGFKNRLNFQKFEDIFLARLWENSHPHTLQILIKNAHPPVDGNSK